MPRNPRIADLLLAADHFLPLEARSMFSGGFPLVADAPGFAGPSVIADFDADGDDDAATISVFPSFSRLDILRNDGSGNLAEWAHFNFSNSLNLPINLAATDFDNDGDLDVFAFGFRLFRNNAGTFGNAEVTRATAIAGTYFLSDFNADGLPDVFVQATSDGSVTRHVNSGGTAVGPGQAVPSPVGASLRAVVDMDSDSDADLVYSDTHAVIYAQNAGGTYDIGTAFNAGFTTPPVIADVNADGRPDLVWGNGQLHTSLNNGNSTFAAAVDSGTTGWLSASAVGDFDADGIMDVLGIRSVGPNRIAGVSFATSAGSYSTAFTDVYTYQTSAEEDPLGYTGQMTADTRSDLVLVRRFNITPLAGFMSVYRSTFGAPQVTSFTGPSDPFVPGRNLNLNLVTSQGKAGAVTTVRIYRDTNGNGEFDQADALQGTATSGANNTWSFTRLIGDGGTGSIRFFAVATDAGDVDSNPASVDVTFWTRVSYPEGWRNDATINEYVPMVNPNPFPVQYRLVAHYETGDRDAVVAEGTIAAFSRGGATISEHANPGGAIVRLNEGYALELQSSAFLGAMLSHYDSFTGDGQGAATGEAFTQTTSSDWYFADVSTTDAAFIIYFNPFDTPVNLDITFYNANHAPVSFQQTIDPLRRLGLSMRNPFYGLDLNSNYAVRLSTNSPIVAALSSYSTTDGSGFSALGRPITPDGPSGFPLVEYRDGVTNRLVLFNTGGGASSATVHLTYVGSATGPATQVVPLAANGRSVIDLNTGRPNDATGVSVRIEGANIRGHVESIDPTRGDSFATAPANRSYSVWAFADGFLDRNTAGTVGFESIALYNPGGAATNVRLRYLFTDGTFADRTLSVNAGGTSRVRLDQDNLILDHAQLNFYSIVVYADTPVVASMIHWDLFQGGGWSTLGTPGGASGLA
jgi:hypothetical protein